MGLPASLVKRCLVTGAGGFVGGVLCERLCAEGVWVRALLRTPQAGPWHEVSVATLGDPTAQPTSDIFAGVDTVFYLAGVAHRQAAPEDCERINTEACLAFARQALEAGVTRFIYISSTKAAEEKGGRRQTEEDNEWPRDAYGKSKRKAEEGLLAMGGFTHLCILRPCLVYGAGVKGNLRSMLNGIATGLFPPLPHVSARRSMVSVRDLVTAIWAASCRPAAHGNLYVVADGEDYSVKEMEVAMRRALGKSIPLWRMPEGVLRNAGVLGDLMNRTLGQSPITSEQVNKLLGDARYSSEKIRRELGWKATETFYLVLPEIIAGCSRETSATWEQAE